MSSECLPVHLGSGLPPLTATQPLNRARNKHGVDVKLFPGRSASRLQIAPILLRLAVPAQ